MSPDSQNDQIDISLKEWRDKEKTALELSKIVGELRFDRSIELVLFRKDLYDARPSQIISDHLFAKNYIDKPLDLSLSLEIARIISKMEHLAPSRLDIGKLASEWEVNHSRSGSLADFISAKLSGGVDSSISRFSPKDVVLYGFGRIGRLVARRLISSTGSGEQLRLKAIVVRAGMKNPHEEVLKRLALLETDSIHGNFPGAIEVSEDGAEAIINGNRIRIIFASHPSEVNYTDYGIQDALLIDNTGLFDTREKLSVHLRPGIAQVILTAPGKDIPNIVVGVNQYEADNVDENIFCAASCTTNAIVPVIQVIDRSFVIEKGHVETVHAYTSDQNLLDNFHRKPRRGRGAPINMVITSTGAASAVAKVLPHLKGKLTGNAVRVPVPDVSLAILNLSLQSPTSVEEVLSQLRKASLHGDLVEQLQYSTSNEYVSSNAVGTTCACVVDAPSTLLSADGKTVTIYAWYDNEFGYACQVVRLAKYVARVRRYTYY